MRKLFFSIIFLITFLLIQPVSTCAAVRISIDSFPSSVIIGQEFSISVSVDGLSPDTLYYIKGRIGTESELDKAETNNPNNSSSDDWLADNDSWSKFPQITLSQNSSSWSGILKLRTRKTAISGVNSLKVRIKKATTDTSYDSPGYEINLQPAPTFTPLPTNPPTFTVTPTNTPVPPTIPNLSITMAVISVTPTRKPIITVKPKEVYEVYSDDYKPTGIVLGENISSSVPLETQKTEYKVQTASLFLLFFFLGGGTICIAIAVFIAIRQIKKEKSFFS